MERRDDFAITVFDEAIFFDIATAETLPNSAR
jgi:hypothetical protein